MCVDYRKKKKKKSILFVRTYWEVYILLKYLLSSSQYLHPRMAEPAELLLIKDQYELAFHSLSRGLTADQAGNRDEALEYYRKGRQHLAQGVEVPTGGERHQGAVWDTARQLQQRMKVTLSSVNAYLSDLATSRPTMEAQRDQLLKDLPPNLYPDLSANSHPPHSSVPHLCPTEPPTSQNATLTPNTAPVSPASPALPPRRMLPAVAPDTIAMAHPGDQPPAYTPVPTDGHRSLAYGTAGGGLESGKQTGAAAAAARGDGNELLYIPSGVQMFFVTPDGQVSSLSNPGYLRIIAFDNDSKGSTAGRPSGFLHVSRKKCCN